MADAPRILGSLTKKKSDLFVAILVIIIVMMLLIPLPEVILDMVMAINIVLSLLIILIVLFTPRVLDFSVFPTLLLMATVYGLALNISSTRLILSRGSQFEGKLVRAFGTFVVGTTGLEGYVIGALIFVVIIVVQVIVITKGSTRVAEVAARFTLDALPGKQMAIEAEYNSGLITEEEATRKKNDLQREADFYGAMDGASKFVSGNVKAGILITLVNVIGGLIVGMTIHGESWEVALDTYISLTIGDGLVTQLPALLISTATGIIVTRAVSEDSFGKDISSQFSNQAKPYLIGAGFLFLLGFLPGFPWWVLFPLSALMLALAIFLSRKLMVKEEEKRVREVSEAERQVPPEMSPVVPLDPLSLELGYGLIPLVDKDQGAELLDRITRIRRESALELGLVIPRIRIIDNMRLEPPEYCFKIKGIEVGRGKIRMNQYLAINPGGIKEEIPGEATVDPTFGLPAIWISEANREKAEQLGYTVVDPPSIIATHLTEIIKRHAAEILGRQEVQAILDTLKTEYSAVIEEVNKSLSIGEIQKVLQGLLAEQVSIRNIIVILESLADFAPISKDLSFLIEKARQALARQICYQYMDENKKMNVITINPELEKKIIDSRVETGKGVASALEPVIKRKWINSVVNNIQAVRDRGFMPIILCSEAARPLVKSSTERELPDLVVISVLEIIPEVHVEKIGEIKLPPE